MAHIIPDIKPLATVMLPARAIGTPSEIRTQTITGLSRSPLPIGVREHMVGMTGLEPAKSPDPKSGAISQLRHIPIY